MGVINVHETEFKLGRAIKKIRNEKGLKANKIAGDLDVHPSTLSKYESDDRKIPSALLPTLAASLGVTVDYIFEQNVDVTPKTNSA
jgi:transcriptional regulator with XRE-family HTH domain